MRHDWIFDVLTDLRSYAQKNNLPETAEGAEVLLRLVRAEVAARSSGDDDGGDASGPGGSPPRGLPH
ncbi:MAG: hypothetical protein ACT4OK_00005 [Gemmobacter sp.]